MYLIDRSPLFVHQGKDHHSLNSITNFFLAIEEKYFFQGKFGSLHSRHLLDAKPVPDPGFVERGSGKQPGVWGQS